MFHTLSELKEKEKNKVNRHSKIPYHQYQKRDLKKIITMVKEIKPVIITIKSLPKV